MATNIYKTMPEGTFPEGYWPEGYWPKVPSDQVSEDVISNIQILSHLYLNTKVRSSEFELLNVQQKSTFYRYCIIWCTDILFTLTSYLNIEVHANEIRFRYYSHN